MALSGLALVWAAVIVASGGFFLRLGPLVVSSRRTSTPLAAAVVCLGAAIGLTLRLGRDGARAEWRWWRTGGSRVAQVSSSFVRRRAKFIPLGILIFVVIQSLGRWTTVRPLWLDEESTLINVRDRTFAELPGTLWLGQSAPLAWMAAERAMMLTVGDGDRPLRLFPVLLGLGMCGVAYWIGRRWLNALGSAVFVFCCGFGQWFVHHRFEAKPYSADIFTTLLLSGLVVWALDAETARDRRLRAIVWWTTAAAMLWLANGALMAGAGCVLILLGVISKRDGLRAAAVAAAWGGVWIASFGLCYWLSLRFTIGSPYLYDYWASIHAFPDQGATVGERLRWLGGRFKELAENPGGTTLWLVLWLSALGGLLLSRRRVLALVAAAVPLTAFLVGLLRVVPLHDRIALWMMPSVYLAVALLADRAGEWWLRGIRRRAWLPIVASLVILAPVGWLSSDVFALRDHDASEMGGTPLNHGLDDRQAVAWLLAHRAPGDALLTTHLAWSSVWWYGGLSLADGQPAAEGRFADGGAELETGFDPSGQSCRHGRSLADRLRDEHRVLIYIGFPDQPGSFGAALEAQLKTLGAIVDWHAVGEGSVAVFDAHVPETLPPAPPGQPCIGVSSAVRW